MNGGELAKNVAIQYYVNDEALDKILLNEKGKYTLRAEIIGISANYEFVVPEELVVEVQEKSQVLIYVLASAGGVGVIYLSVLGIRKIRPRKRLLK